MAGAGHKRTDGFVRPQVAEVVHRPQVAEVVHRPDGTTDRTKLPPVWTLAHRGYSGSKRLEVAGRLDVWVHRRKVYRRKAEALLAGARLAMDCGLDEDPTAVQLFSEKNYADCSQALRGDPPRRIPPASADRVPAASRVPVRQLIEMCLRPSALRR
jgi:hypothetical protein